MKESKKSSGIAFNEIDIYLNRTKIIATKLYRISVNGILAESQRFATNHLYTLMWAIGQLEKYCNKQNLDILETYLNECDEFINNIYELEKTGEIAALKRMVTCKQNSP